jgi:hypothetical protein
MSRLLPTSFAPLVRPQGNQISATVDYNIGHLQTRTLPYAVLRDTNWSDWVYLPRGVAKCAIDNWTQVVLGTAKQGTSLTTKRFNDSSTDISSSSPGP